MGGHHPPPATVIPPRFHVAEAAPGARLSLPEHSAHHAREVLRLRAGAPVHVFDGRGNEYDAVLDSVTRGGVGVRVAGPVAALAESPLRITLALPPLKGDRMELVIQKATELGVVAVWPVVTVRTDAVGRPALRGSRQERWDKVASGAAEQCGRAVVPEVAATTTLDELLKAPFEGRRLSLAPGGGKSLPAERPSSVLLLVGPAGGFEPRELEAAELAGFQPVAFGPRVLRAETAAIACVAVVQSLWGDLR
jgi:16S rRNA (uracil1498-N3)-methyltransferase